MDKVILIDIFSNAVDLQRYLISQSDEFSRIKILERKNVLLFPDDCKDVRYIFSTWNMPRFSYEEIIECFPSLSAVFYAAGDMRYFEEPYIRKGVKLFSAQRENAIPVAELVLAQILLANKGYFQAVEKYRRGFWRIGFAQARSYSKAKPGNFGAKVGIIGLGLIGSELAKLLMRFDFQTLVYDPYVDDQKISHLGGERVSLSELFRECDVVSNHLPDHASTRALLDYRYFSLMKPTATFINSGRGAQVDENGLARAMRECPSRCALLDVTSREPPHPFSPLYRVSNIFISPHIAGSQENEYIRLYNSALRDYYQMIAN